MCDGAGEIISSPCQDCRGSGKIKEKKTLNLKVPPGVDEGTKLRIEREGEAGDRGASRGDLYVIIHVKKHKYFEREGSDLYFRVPVSFTQAALGANLEIPTLEENETLKIPAGTQPDEVIKLKGKGIKDLHGFRKGDLFVKIDVQTPVNLSKEEKESLRQFAQLRGDALDTVDKSIIDKLKDLFH